MGSEQYRKSVFKFGHGHELQIADLPTDLWEGSSGLYPFQDKPIELYISSSNVADVGIPVLVEGLNADGMIQQVIVILNGQTQVKLDGWWWRQYRAANADTGTDIQGYVYIAEQDTLTGGVPDTASKIKIIIESTFQQTQMLVYTTPRDWEARLPNLFIGIVPKTTSVAYAKVGLYMRQPGKSWTNQGYLGLITSGTSIIQLCGLEKSGIINPFTDIVFRAVELSANGIELAGSFTIDFIRKVK